MNKKDHDSREIIEIIVNLEAVVHVFYKKRVLKSFAKFTGKHLIPSLFSNEVADWEGLQPY